MGKHKKSLTAQEQQAQAKADAFDAQYAESQANYVEPTLQEKVDAYNEMRKDNARIRGTK